MSGGLYDYKDGELSNEMFGEYRPEMNKYKEARHGDPMEDIEMSCLVYDVMALIHSLDWYRCGDTSQSDYIRKIKMKVSYKISNFVQSLICIII